MLVGTLRSGFPEDGMQQQPMKDSQTSYVEYASKLSNCWCVSLLGNVDRSLSLA